MNRDKLGLLQEDLESLWDPHYKRHLLEKFSLWVEEYDSLTETEKRECAHKIRIKIITTLKHWLDIQQKDNTETDSIASLIFTLSELANEFEYYVPNELHIERVAIAWQAYQAQEGINQTQKYKDTSPIRLRDQKRQNASKRGGKSTAKLRKEETAARNEQIVIKAKEFIEAGRNVDCVSLLAELFTLSRKRIRDILKEHGITPNPKKGKHA